MGITKKDVEQVYEELIQINAELDELDKTAARTMLLKCIDHDEIINGLENIPVLFGLNYREKMQDKLLHCHTVALLDDITPSFVCMGGREKRYRFMNILADIYTEGKIKLHEVMTSRGVAEFDGEDHTQITLRYLNECVDKMTHLTDESKQKIKDYAAENTDANDPMSKELLTMCPFKLETFDEDIGMIINNPLLKSMFASRYRNDLGVLADDFIVATFYAIKEFLREILTKREQKKNN